MCVRDDSSINLSGEQFEQICKPYDAQPLGRFGGWVHFCGRAHQWWPKLLDVPGLKGINPYQGEFYDLAQMHSHCERARVALLQWTTPVDAACREQIRTGFSRVLWVADWQEAQRAKERLYATGHADP